MKKRNISACLAILLVLAGFLAYCGESYKPKVKEISLISDKIVDGKLSLAVGESERLIVTIKKPSSIKEPDLIWNSDDPGVATVEDGTVTAVSAGTAVVSVTIKPGDLTSSCEVEVNDE